MVLNLASGSCRDCPSAFVAFIPETARKEQDLTRAGYFTPVPSGEEPVSFTGKEKRTHLEA